MEENIRFFEVVEELKSRGVLSDYIQLAGVLETNKAGISDLKNDRIKLSLPWLNPAKFWKSMKFIRYPINLLS